MSHIPPPQAPSEPNVSSVTYSTVNTGNANISVNVILTLRSDGGYPVSQYTVTSIPGYRSNTNTTNVIVLNNLTRGQTYTFVANAYHIVGSSANSNVSASYTLAQVPASPTMGTATATGATTANVTYSASSDNGGANITSYTATSIPSGGTGTLNQAGSGTINVTGLTTGTSYTFTVTATNSAGTGANSAVSNQVTEWSIPDAPTIGTATTTGATTATVSFTAPTLNGNSTITSYTATSSPGGITGSLSQAGSGTISITGLTAGTTYTFTVTATNSVGTSANSAASNQITYVTPSSTSYTTAGTYSFIPTSGVTSVSIVAIGAGGGGGWNGGGNGGGAGGGLGYKNNYPVTPGTPYTLVVGGGGIWTPSGYCASGIYSGNSYFVSTSVVFGGGGQNAAILCYPVYYPNGCTGSGNWNNGWAKGGSYVGDGGGNGGNATRRFCNGGGGGGAGGYSGTGGTGGSASTNYNGGQYIEGAAGSGGGGGGGAANGRLFPTYTSPSVTGNGGGGGGVGLFGSGSSGAGGGPSPWGTGGGGGGAGSGGAAGSGGGYPACAGGGTGGNYGGGTGGLSWAPVSSVSRGAGGAIRVVWPGTTRQFPTTCVGTP
jgi:hypothetical protein